MCILIIWGRILGIKNAEVCIDIDINPGSMIGVEYYVLNVLYLVITM